MTRFGITFDEKHSYKDFGLTVSERTIGYPRKIKVKERIPFSNQIYDFSGIYGEQEYEERTLTYVFNVKDYEKVNMQYQNIEIINWLMMPDKKVKLIDDHIIGYHFLAELEEKPDFEELRFHGRLTVNFTAYPFMIAELEEGNDIWDIFNFLLDYAQITEFDIEGSLNDVVLYNPGVTTIHPVIKATSPMRIIKEHMEYDVPPGNSKSMDFALSPGENDLKIIGNGTISFHFRKEVI